MPNPIFTKPILGKIDSRDISKASLYGKFVHYVMRVKAQESFDHIKPFIKKSDKILDLGLGTGTFTQYLKEMKYNASGVDVVNLSFYKDIQPVIYNGKKLPFKNNEFDVVTIIGVLHHCGLKDENKKVLAEAMRVSKRVILIDDSYRNRLERRIISNNDQFSNGEYWEHVYLKNNEWFDFFYKMKWRVVFAKQYSQFAFRVLYTRYVMYVLEKN